MKQIKKIGVFISHIYGEYQSMLCEGIIHKATEYGYLVEIFSSNEGENLGDYGLGEFGILHIPNVDDYAGIIFASDTYRLISLKDEITKLLETQFTCPIIDIAQSKSPFPRIILENNNPFEDLVTHLAKVHQYKHICYLGNIEQPKLSNLRYHAYQRGIKNLNLPLSDQHFYECTNTKNQIAKAVTFFLNTKQRPEAILCYNDEYALSVIEELRARGMKVPEDIAVTGCDTLEFGQNTMPSLTSVTFPIEELGESAMNQLIRIFHGETIEPLLTVNASPHIASSCGCCIKNAENHSYSHILKHRIDTLENHLVSHIHMSSTLHNVTDIDQGMDILAQFLIDLPECKEFYLCLYEGWDRVSKHIRILTNSEKERFDTNTILLKLALKDGKRLPECTFIKHNCLPNYIYEKDCTYIYTPLFFGENNFGYVALSYHHDKVGYSFSFISWLMNINSMLKNICDNKNMGLLVGRLEDIYLKDELTGLYNTQGLQHMSQKLIQTAILENRNIMIAIYDLDCLKIINDTYGHLEGNFAIQVLAHALENSIEDGVICARLGGDQFQVLAIDYTNEMAKLLRSKVRTYIDNYNRLTTKEYVIQISCGFCVRSISSKDEMDNLLDQSYKQLYQEKRKKEIHRQSIPD